MDCSAHVLNLYQVNEFSKKDLSYYICIQTQHQQLKIIFIFVLHSKLVIPLA